MAVNDTRFLVELADANDTYTNASGDMFVGILVGKSATSADDVTLRFNGQLPDVRFKVDTYFPFGAPTHIGIAKLTASTDIDVYLIKLVAPPS